MTEQIKAYFQNLFIDVVNVDADFAIAFLLIASIVIVWEAISTFAKQKRKEVGFGNKEFASSMKASSNKPLKVRRYVSDMQLLSGTPDALISENGFIIPIERKPFAKKIHDRYVVQLLVYMRLVEEFEGKKPPYGYLILGENCRCIKVHNTPEKQAWLQKIIDEMQAILNENREAVPQPVPSKCKNCQVRNYCKYAACTENSTNTEK